MDCDKLVTIKVGKRCMCYRKMTFDHQCCHEMCSEGGFDIERLKNFQQMHPTFWLNDHLPACSNNDTEEEGSVEGP
jgi:hypothetical protein